MNKSVHITCPTCGYMIKGRPWRCPGCGGYEHDDKAVKNRESRQNFSSRVIAALSRQRKT